MMTVTYTRWAVRLPDGTLMSEDGKPRLFRSRQYAERWQWCDKNERVVPVRVTVEELEEVPDGKTNQA